MVSRAHTRAQFSRFFVVVAKWIKLGNMVRIYGGLIGWLAIKASQKNAIDMHDIFFKSWIQK